jgi:Collagen triple helix repeat (20 copies)
MAKFQVPTVGGIRKVIRPGGSAAPGTTIAELGSGVISLAQLAAILLQIQTQQNNTGGGNIGPTGAGGVAGKQGALGMLGPPGDDGSPGEDGPPGVAGATGAAGAAGATGPAGAAGLIFLGEDGSDGDLGPPGPPGPLGATGNTGGVGPTGPTGPIMFLDDGLPGDDGAPGGPGPTGAAGTPGGIGPTGPVGPAVYLDAEPGEQGDWTPGPVGPSGALGPTGGVGPASPAVFILAADGEDGDWGRPGDKGIQGVTGAQGPQGPVYLIPDEPMQDDGMLCYPPNVFGPTSFAGPVVINWPNPGIALSISGSGEALRIRGDTSILAFRNSAGTGVFQIGTVEGWSGSGVNVTDGAIGAIAKLNFYAGSLTTASIIVSGNANVTITSGFGLQGARPAVTAGQTDLGVTTTVTVITTAGGIALPALASTFWCINVNGVAYGIPCFAL